MPTIVIATSNPGKVHEYRTMFGHRGFEVKSLLDFKKSEVPTIVENGHSFEENATIKCKKIMNWLHIPVLGDDSGLEVKALNNAPGIYSARYAGDHNDLANQWKLLYYLKGQKNRQAQFVTCLVFLKPDGTKIVAKGIVKGEILTKKIGHDGFGYDPLFYYPKLKKSFAQLTTDEKDAISQRGRAARSMLKKLQQAKILN